ncbi:presqualene diphosphate synthase HpnD [Candidatus Methylomirabilis sp.]|uniref:Presqualene diphosphate synthase HpnD n=1 Tax=Candidatus Methylomirabilis tolerans TaxID=3123416 RepID=A0AAJ1EIB8_9BACT|nr:presqualene diphosphate synthase HpnD [Candidatus Methylomirabilis sp.]
MNQVDDLRTHSRTITKQSGSNFSSAFLFLPKPKREAIYAVYAFCRLSDDLVDESRAGGDPAAELARWRHTLDTCLQDNVGPPVIMAVGQAARRFNIPKVYFEELLNGMEMDLVRARYATFEELYPYCYRVASIVGLICIEIFGYTNPQAKIYAEQLGIAFQLTNILRDVGVDAQRGRIYLPQDELKRFGYSEEDLLAGRYNHAFVELMRFQCERARGFFQAASAALAAEDTRSLLAAEIMRAIYYRLLLKIEAQQYDVFHGNITIGKYRKLLLAGTLWLRSVLSP